MKILNWFLNLFRNSKKIAQDAIDIVNVLKSIVENPLAHAVDELITGNTKLVENSDKWLTEALNALGLVVNNTVKGAINEFVADLGSKGKDDRGIFYNLTASQMHSMKSGTSLEVSKDIVENIYQDGK